MGVGCLGLLVLPAVWAFGVQEPWVVLFLPALLGVTVALQGLASWRIRKPFRALQHKLGQCYLGDYVRGQTQPRSVALRGRALPHGEQTFVWVGLAPDGGRVHTCRGPALVWDRLAERSRFSVVERDLTVEESEALGALLEKRLESVPSKVYDGHPCEVAVNDGVHSVYRASVNLSDADDEAPVTRLVRHLLEL